jgi:hypothetical protein
MTTLSGLLHMGHYDEAIRYIQAQSEHAQEQGTVDAAGRVEAQRHAFFAGAGGFAEQQTAQRRRTCWITPSKPRSAPSFRMSRWKS